jgi:hypothetical protein
MKTYNTTIEKPCLTIEYDTDAENPREWDNLGYFFTKEQNHISPYTKEPSLYSIMLKTENEAEDTANHMALIKKEAKKQGYKIKYIMPVYKYEHSNVVYRLGTANGFDYSNCGFYIVLSNSETKAMTKKQIESNIIGELETYTKWCNGEVYVYTLNDENGDYLDSCGGIYDIEDIRENLPEEYQKENLEDYFIN